MLSTAQATAPRERQTRLHLTPALAQQYLETLYSRFFSQAKGQAYLEMRGKREGEELRFRRFYPSIEALIKDMPRWKPDLNYWVGVALRRDNQGGKKENLLALTASFNDVDCGAAGHKVAPRYQDRVEALAAIEQFPLRPTILIDSGGGCQPYWLFQEPVELTDGNLAKVERINRGLALALGGDVGATDAARILRLPGTYNMKLPNNPRPVKTIWCEPDRVYDLAELAQYEAKPQAHAQGQRQAHQGGARPSGLGDYVAYAQAALEKELAELAQASEGERNTRLNQAAFALGQLIGAGVLDRGSVEAALYDTALSIGLGDIEARATIKSGIEAGLKEPRELPEREWHPGPEPEPKDHQVGEGEGKGQEPQITNTELLNFARASQVGDARLFIRLFTGKYCYDHAAGHWYQWDGHYWIEDDLNNVLMALDQVIDVYERQAQQCAWKRARATREGNEALAKQAAKEEDVFLKKIAQLQKKDWRRDVLYFAAAGEGSLGITGNGWDMNPLLIACPNGVIDLNTGGFRDGRPDDFIKTVCPTEWRGQLEPAPQWDKFLSEIFDGDQELVSYKQRLCGYAISGQRIERVMPICWGVGWNGKGTFFETIEHALGELAGPVPAEVLLEESKHQHKSGGAPTPEIMRLRGKRLAWASETNEGRRLNAGKVKWLTGGDTLIGRDPFGKKMVAFQPTHTLFLMTNHQPKANPDDPALWGRIHLIPFELSFVDNPTDTHHRKRNKHLADKLKKEACGILAWFVRGFSEWKKRGLDPPPKVSDATEKYRQDQDTVGQFIAEKCKLAAGMQVKSSELFKEYRQWCDDNGFKPVWGNTFGERMKAKFENKPTMNGVFYYGIGLLDQEI